VTATHADGPGHGSVPSDPDAEIVEGELMDDDATEATTAESVASEEEEMFVDGTVGRSDLAAERDEYLEALQRVKAEFDNYRRRTESQRAEMVERAVGQVVEQLLPILDACEAAVGHGATEVEPIQSALVDTLGREGLERMEVVGAAFDPNLHEAVMHEPGDGSEETITESFRSGYLWKGRVLRPAMVKVRG
jgi:molecular chaperone GrpE